MRVDGASADCCARPIDPRHVLGHTYSSVPLSDSSAYYCAAGAQRWQYANLRLLAVRPFQRNVAVIIVQKYCYIDDVAA